MASSFRFYGRVNPVYCPFAMRRRRERPTCEHAEVNFVKGEIHDVFVILKVCSWAIIDIAKMFYISIIDFHE